MYHLYYPRLQDGTQAELLLSTEDFQRMVHAGRGLHIKGEVTDLRTGERYRILGASCGLPHCCCAALAVPLEQKVPDV
jgi:hypothetical protein